MEDPGTRYRYSESTNVLGRLVEVWSGQPLDAFLEGHVFRPLGMVDSRFWAGPGERARLTTVYAPADAGGLRAIETEPQPFTERPALIEGAVGLLSSAHDFIRFSQMLLNKGELDGVRLLNPSTIALMTVNRLPPAILQTRRGGAMGWTLLNVEVVMDPAAVPYPSRRGELSWDGTAGTIFWVDPEKELATVLMAQIVPTDPDRIRRRFKTIVEEAVY
jgi:CubicO group peptidase (beta-lactamase class C family)